MYVGNNINSYHIPKAWYPQARCTNVTQYTSRYLKHTKKNRVIIGKNIWILKQSLQKLDMQKLVQQKKNIANVYINASLSGYGAQQFIRF